MNLEFVLMYGQWSRQSVIRVPIYIISRSVVHFTLYSTQYLRNIDRWHVPMINTFSQNGTNYENEKIFCYRKRMVLGLHVCMCNVYSMYVQYSTSRARLYTRLVIHTVCTYTHTHNKRSTWTMTAILIISSIFDPYSQINLVVLYFSENTVLASFNFQ